MFFNYKKSFSIVLLAVCNSNYEFTMVDIGESGRQSDGGTFANSNIGQVITNDLCDIPNPCKLDRSTFIAPLFTKTHSPVNELLRFDKIRNKAHSP